MTSPASRPEPAADTWLPEPPALLSPWHTPARVVPYHLEIIPGDVIATLGRPLTIFVQVHPLDAAHPVLPSTCR